jgi:hypothetical protein
VGQKVSGKSSGSTRESSRISFSCGNADADDGESPDPAAENAENAEMRKTVLESFSFSRCYENSSAGISSTDKSHYNTSYTNNVSTVYQYFVDKPIYVLIFCLPTFC